MARQWFLGVTTRLVATLLAIAPLALRAQESANRLDAAQLVLGSTDPQFQRLIDIDGDAFDDALGMRGGGNVSELRLYQNQGDGRFVGVWNHTINWSGIGASGLTPLEVGDFDGDGRKDDFAISSGSELIFFQGGNATANAGTPLALPETARDILVVDLDQNGTDDLVTLFTSFVSITLNPLGPSPFFDAIPIGATTADTELMAIHLTTGNIALVAGTVQLIYTPGAGLSTGPAWGVGIIPGHAISGDLDGDGDEDGVIFSANAQYQRFIQGSNGSLVPGGVLDASRAHDLVDLDGDGDLDAIFGGIAANSATLTPNDGVCDFEFSENDGSGHFGPLKAMRGHGAQRLAGVSDLDGDGDLDFLAGRCIYFGRNSSVFARPSVEQGSVGLGIFAPNALDLDDDGDLDLGLTAQQIFRNDGSGNMTRETPTFLGTPPPFIFSGLVVGDWNFDGRSDVIYNQGSTAYVAYNLGGGALAWYPNPVASGTTASAFGTSSVVADLDQDGDFDCAGVQQTGFAQSTVIAINTGASSFTSGGTVLSEAVAGAADIDSDGLLDLVTRDVVTLGTTTGRLSWVRQAPLHSFTNRTTIITGIASGGRPLLRDLDGDGDIDLIAYLPAVGHVLFTNDGSGGFTQTVLVANTGSTTSLGMNYGLADVSGDGVLDILASPAPDASSCAVILEATPTGYVPMNVVHAFVPDVCADVDGDGDADAIDFARGGISRSLVIDGPNRGSRRQYGHGTAGSGGLVPTLGATGPFREGGVSTLRLRNALGGALAFLAFSTIPAQLPDYPAAGIDSYLDPLAPTSLVWPAFALGGTPTIQGTGSGDVSFFLPVGVAGLEIHHQAFLLDPQGPSGISASEGLVIRYGL